MAHKEMKAELTCPICIELFRQPRRLPCGHAYCHRCISTLLQVRAQQEWTVSRRLVCPECREQMRVDYVLGIEALPIDFKLSRLVELVRSMESNSSNSDDTESASPVREFPESRPVVMPSSSSSSSASTPAAMAAPNSEGFDLIGANSSPSPPLSVLPSPTDNEIPSPQAENVAPSSVNNIPLPFPGLPENDYSLYLDTLTYPELWTEATSALNNLLENFESHHGRLSEIESQLSGYGTPPTPPLVRRLRRGSSPADHILSSSSSSTSSLDEPTGRRPSWSSSSSSTSSDHHWVRPTSTNVVTTADSSTTDAVAANATTTTTTVDDNGNDRNIVHSSSIENNAIGAEPINDSTGPSYRARRGNHDGRGRGIVNLDTSTDEATLITSGASTTQNSRINAENSVNNNDIGARFGSRPERPINFDPDTTRHNHDDIAGRVERMESDTENLNAQALREFLRFRDNLPRFERSSDTRGAGNVGGEDGGAQTGETNEADGGKGKDNFRIKYLKLKKRVVNIFKDSYSTTESSDEEIAREREKQKEKERKKQEEEREEAQLKAVQRKISRETRKWRMTRHLMAVILSDDSTSSDSNDERENGIEDRRHNEGDNIARSGRQNHHVSDSNNNDRDTHFRPFPSRRRQRKIPFSGMEERGSDSTDETDDDDDDDFTGTNAPILHSRFILGPHISPSLHPDMSSPLHGVYPMPSIPPLPSVYDNVGGNESADQLRARSHPTTPSCHTTTQVTSTAHPLTQQSSQNPISVSVLFHSITHLEGNDGHGNTIETPTTAITLSSLRSRDDGHDNVIPRSRLASEAEGGGTFYDNICEQEIVQALHGDLRANAFLSGRVGSSENGNRNDERSVPVAASVRPEIEDLKVDIESMEISNGDGEMAEAWPLDRDSHSSPLGMAESERMGNCEMESLKLKLERRRSIDSSDSTDTVRKMFVEGGGSDCHGDVVQPGKGAKPHHREFRSKQQGPRNWGEGAGLPSKSAGGQPQSVISLYDNVGSNQRGGSANGLQVGGAQAEELARCRPSESTRGEREKRKTRRINEGSQAVILEDNERHRLQESVHCDENVPTVASSGDLTVMSVPTLAAPIPISSSSSSVTTATTSNVTQNVAVENTSSRGAVGVGNETVRDDRDSHGGNACAVGQADRNNGKMDNTNDDDESDLEAAAPHSAMLKFSEGSGSVGGKKQKSRFRKFISSLMWVSSSSSSDDNYDGDDNYSDF